MNFSPRDHQLTLKEEKVDQILEPAAQQFMASPKYQIENIPMFEGVGVYALYVDPQAATIYQGVIDEDYPIYVGKAVPSGSRQGRTSDSKRQLRGRLMEHKRSIEHGGLPASAFKCRFMTMSGVAEDLISAMESKLVKLFHPLWNSYIDGFGIHTPGKGRFNQQPSEWDTLHPGRPFLKKLTGERRDEVQIRNKILNYQMRKVE